MNEPSLPSATNSSQPRRGWSLRFSLLSLCGLVAVACIAAAWYGMRQRERLALEKAASLEATVKSQSAEINRLRAELGYLTIGDRSKVNVLMHNSDDENHWKWRVYLPPGKNWNLCFGLGEVPLRGFEGVRHSATTTQSGEYTIEARFDRDENGQRRFVVSRNGVKTAIAFPDEEFQRLKAAGHSATTLGASQTQQFDPTGPIELIRLRQHRVVPGSSPGLPTSVSSDEPEFGFVIWLE